MSYEVAIIGAGLAGLTAAGTLKDYRLVMLEAAPRAGGRILTKTHGALTYDLGAIFAGPRGTGDLWPEEAPLKAESATIGIFCDDRLVLATGVAGCLNQLQLAPAEKADLRRCMQQPTASVQELSPRLQKLLNAFFHLIHPGDIWDYRPERKNDATRKFDTTHYVEGNGQLVQHLLGNSRAKLLTSAVVESVRQDGDRVCIECLYRGERQHLEAAAAIVTVPAPIAAKLVISENPYTRAFLQRLRFAGGMSVAIGLNHVDLPEFGYLATPDLPVAAVIQQRYADSGQSVLLTCYSGPEAERLGGLPADEAVDQTITHLHRMHLDVPPKESLLFYDTQQWPFVGPIIDAAYDAWSLSALHPEPGVFLAGDYTAFDPVNAMPYGMNAAIASGKRAAADVRKTLESRSPVRRFAHRHLVDVSRYQMDQERPVYIGSSEEGNIALNGIVLQADPDNAPLKRYLMAASRGDLWEWQQGFGVTLDDSAFVMAGLLAAGVPAATLRPSADQLVTSFFDDTSGAFCTLARHAQVPDEHQSHMARGRAAYWAGPTVDATAHAIWLLHQIAPEAYATEIRRGNDYLTQSQTAPGSWPSRWFPSPLWTLWFATRALALEETVFKTNLQRSVAFLSHTQMTDGSWGHRTIDTALALLTIEHVAPEQNRLAHGARQWLLSERGPDGAWRGGEPILYYWYELEDGRRIFHHCVDKGAVATAWARLALARDAKSSC